MSDEERGEGDEGAEIDLPMIGGRQCVPVRLLPFLTDWRPLSPDRITELLGAGEPLQGRRWKISAYILRSNGAYSRVLPRDWAHLSEKLAVLATELLRSEEFEGQNDDEWERRSVALLPAACFVWRAELEAEYKRTYRKHAFIRFRPGARRLSEAEGDAELATLIHSTDQAELDRIQQRALDSTITLEGDGSLYFSPVLTEVQRRLAFEGFQVPRNSADARPVQRSDVPRQAQQEAAILAKLIEHGHNPERMPKAPRGNTPWPLREQLRTELSYSVEVMRKAWKRLRADGRIK